MEIGEAEFCRSKYGNPLLMHKIVGQDAYYHYSRKKLANVSHWKCKKCHILKQHGGSSKSNQRGLSQLKARFYCLREMFLLCSASVHNEIVVEPYFPLNGALLSTNGALLSINGALLSTGLRVP